MDRFHVERVAPGAGNGAAAGTGSGGHLRRISKSRVTNTTARTAPTKPQRMGRERWGISDMPRGYTG